MKSIKALAGLGMSILGCWGCLASLMKPNDLSIVFIIAGGVFTLIGATCLSVLLLNFLDLNPDHKVRPVPVVILKANDDKTEEKPDYEDRYLRL